MQDNDFQNIGDDEFQQDKIMIFKKKEEARVWFSKSKTMFCNVSETLISKHARR
jgi:catabolite regulation protein CreA